MNEVLVKIASLFYGKNVDEVSELERKIAMELVVSGYLEIDLNKKIYILSAVHKHNKM